MNLSTPFILRPVATSLLMLGLCFAGLGCYALLPIAGVPQVDIPTIQVTASLPGASAETMAATVAVPLERQLALLPGVASMSSSSVLGSSQIQLQFDLSRQLDGAALDVQSAINAAAGDLPKNLPHPPTFEKANPADALLMSIAVSSDSLPIAKVDDIAENYLTPQLSRIAGVGVIDYHGQQKPAVRVQVDPARLAGLGVALEDIRAALASGTASTPKGTLNDLRRSVTLDATDQLFNADGYRALIVTYRNGAPVRLGDVATVLDSVEDVRQAAWVGQHQAVIADVHKQLGFNINETVARIKDALPGLTRNLPGAVQLSVLQDRTQTIRRSVIDIQITLLIAIALVVLVVYLFVRDLRATLIPGIAIPLSVLGTLVVMELFGYTLDNISLMALTVVVGFVVDDAIVMLENILRHVESGQPPLAAAIAGAREIGPTILSMTLSLVAVFVPLLFMGGLVGRLFREFAVTATVAIVVSGLVSLTLTPMMCARFLGHGNAPRRAPGAAQRVYDRSLQLYGRMLRGVMRHQRLTAASILLIAAGTVTLYALIPKGFFPNQDNGLIAGVAEAPEDISFEAMSARIKALAALVGQDPEVEHVYYWVEGENTTHLGRLSVDLKPFGQRRGSVYEAIKRIQRRIAVLPGIVLHMQARQDVQVGARVSKTQYQYTLHDPELGELNHWAPLLLDALRKLPQLEDVEGDLDPAAPRLTVEIDRDAMSRLGVSAQAIDDTLYDAFGQRQVASFYTAINTYRVILEVEPRFQLDANALSRLYVPSGSGGRQIPLDTIARFRPSLAPLTVNHDGQFPSVTLSFNLAAGSSLGEAVDAIESRMRGMNLPATLSADFAGSAQVFKSSLASQPYLIAAAILAIYIVLGVLYENYIHPLTILSTLPSGGLGALAALMLFHIDFSLIALIGVILLIGIVKKNGIMMVDFALARQRQGNVTPEQAIHEACLMRFRPIMMTTFAALLGALPLAFGSGAGSELRRPLGITTVGGLLISQVLTLFTTPVIYLYVHRLDA
ncbi:MAG: efflux RND transporter permease subunit, partial [Nevskia sp.]|nr:efflux RND transporter permease subunit [Nevskia sp.]